MKERFLAFCGKCNLQYSIIRKIGELGEWKSSRVNLADLVNKLTDEEFNAIEDEIEANEDSQTIDQEVDWMFFTIALESSDEIWEYIIELEGETNGGLAIKRGNYIISSYQL
jgi:hypothetical protein